MGLKDFIGKGLVNGLFKVDKENFHHIDFSEKTIIMPNHISLADAAVLAFNLPPEVVFVANTHSAKKYSFIHKLRKVITIDTSNANSLRTVIELINEGTPVVIFPEGRITTTGAMMKIYEGVGFIASKTNANIYPIMINGLERSKWSYTNHLWKNSYFPKTKLTVGTPFKLKFDENDSSNVQRKKALEEISKRFADELAFSRLKDKVNLFNELLESAEINGYDKEMASGITGTSTYKDLIVSSYILSLKIKKLLHGKTKVGLFLPNSVEHVKTLYSLFYNGITPAILNYSSGVKTLIDCSETIDLKVIITSRKFVEVGGFSNTIIELEKTMKVVYLEDIREDISSTDKVKGYLLYLQRKKSTYFDNELILFTSGSESKPKGVALSHENIYSNIIQIKTIIPFTGTDKIFNAMPMFHSFGLTAGTILPLTLGVPTYLYPKPIDYKNVPAMVYSTNSTVLFGTSTFLEGYAKMAHNYDFYSLRYVVAGAERLKEEVQDLWYEKFGLRILEGYGATETAPVLSINTPLNYKKGTVGKLLPMISHKVEPVEGIPNGGKLYVQGPNVMKGYYLHEKGFVPHTGWYDTGDVVEVGEDSFVTIKSRLKRFAKIAGEMVSLNLIEEIAQKCYGSTSFYAVSIADKKKGEQVILFTTEEVDIKVLKKYIKDEKISAINTPASIEVLSEIPLLGSGKPDYVQMRELADNITHKEGFFSHLIKKVFKRED